MSSTDTYIPYFYIIQHKISKKLYCGSKWAIGCNPDTFMVPDGYTTSSPTINSIIEQEGLDSFDILRIDTNLNGLSSYDYETLFLQCNNCAESDRWLNGHNNTGMAFGLPLFKEKSKQTSLKNWGTEHPMQSTEYKEIFTQLNNDKWGFDNAFQVPEFKEKSKESMLTKYNYKYSGQVPEFKEKSKETNLKNRGVEYPSQSPVVRDKTKQKLLETTGYDNPAKMPFLSIIETKKSYAKCHISRYFPEMKQYFPE